jgi:GTPase SAR1 family protein
MENRQQADRPHGAAGHSFSEASRVFRTCEALAAREGSPLEAVTRQLGNAWRRLAQPMRLAVAGQVKRGKSTLVNALLGEQVAATGQLEVTFSISEFCHGRERGIFVHYEDGTVEGPLSPAMLDALTVRDPVRLDQLGRIRTVEFAMPNELLRTFRLVDTPGLGSVHLADSENTARYLGVGDMHTDSLREIVKADAVLYLFSRALHERDDETLTDFLGDARSHVTPLRAFGVLSKCDEYWPPSRDQPGDPDPVEYDPMQAARPIAEQYMDDVRTSGLFYTVVPVAGLIGIGARLLTGEELDWLGELSREDPRHLVRHLRDAGRFATAPQLKGVSLPAASRERLIQRLGAWGTFRACAYLRAGLGEGKLRDSLEADSGVTRLHDLIASHFGHRASVIKLDHGLQEVTAEIGRCRIAHQRAGEDPPGVVNVIADRLTQLRLGDHDSAELWVLAAHYNGQLDLRDAEVREILAVTGEYGITWAARLGELPEHTPLRELRAAAEAGVARWARREQDPTLNQATTRAAHIIRLSYDRILSRLPPPMPDEPTTGA